ncbi:Zinc/iron permease [Pleomassaria siparia CBS 279.74]|uniref:Zinc/iron permease n=1 Tax=Pleomassaria siparia CBS 279.74 TaxID=1314801 RepID=A0A6G1KRT0_9PLEO|nr:Zinc/iron permease [Pleomassaria siparia CBS 279.74]
MWDGLFMLFTLSTIMAIASFIAGLLPLSFALSSRQLRIITFLGTGVLVGTSLIVIIPEGIETMYSAGRQVHAHENRTPPIKIAAVASQQNSASNANEFAPMERSKTMNAPLVRRSVAKDPMRAIIVRRTPEPIRRKEDKQKTEDKEKVEEKKPEPQKGGDDDSTEGHKEGHTRVHGPEDQVEEVHHTEETRDPHAYIGVSLVLGFILMFLVDHLPEALSPPKPKYQSLHISLSNLSRGPHNSSAVSLNGMNTSPPPGPEPMLPPRSSATTIGLVVHACADGIALGASSTAPSTSLSLVIFFAIMLHKAPAAFGLTSVLLKQGLSKRTVRTHLVLFSLAAPVGALATWAIVHALGRARLGGDDGLTFTTGWVLLFSGGTFLYVAMHSMIEATSGSHARDDLTANGYAERDKRGLSRSDIAIVMTGMLLPLITQVGHVH